MPNPASYLPLLFAAIALAMFGLSARDYFRNERTMTVAGKVRFRIALIFLAVSILLLFLRRSFP